MGARREPTRRGPDGEERALRRAPGLSFPLRSEMQEPPGAGGGAGAKFLETRVARSPGRPVPLAPRSRVGAKSPPPASRLGPRAPYRFGSARGWRCVLLRGSRLLQAGPARAPPSPLRPRPGRAARTLPAPRRPLPRGGARAGGGASARTGAPRGGSRRGTRGAAGGARAHCALRRRARLPRRTAPTPGTPAPPTLLCPRSRVASSSVSQHTSPLFPASASTRQPGLGRECRGDALGYFLDTRGLKARKQI